MSEARHLTWQAHSWDPSRPQDRHTTAHQLCYGSLWFHQGILLHLRQQHHQGHRVGREGFPAHVTRRSALTPNKNVPQTCGAKARNQVSANQIQQQVKRTQEGPVLGTCCVEHPKSINMTHHVNRTKDGASERATEADRLQDAIEHVRDVNASRSGSGRLPQQLQGSCGNSAADTRGHGEQCTLSHE